MAAARPPIRRLVFLWIAQNVLLVASTILRTLDYVDAYSLTRLRIAALIWMALVAIGLVLICWRIARGRSGAWLINANALAALLTLSACCFVDLGSVAAGLERPPCARGRRPGAALDLCYLNQLDASALLPLIDLESGRCRRCCASAPPGLATCSWTGSSSARPTGAPGPGAARGAWPTRERWSPPATCPASPPAGGSATARSRPPRSRRRRFQPLTATPER